MAVASLPCEAASAARSAAARAIACVRAARSAAGGPAPRAVAGASARCVSGPAARPGAATRPRRRRASTDIGEILLDQADEREDGRLRILALGAEIKQRVVRRLRRDNLDDALGVDT